MSPHICTCSKNYPIPSKAFSKVQNPRLGKREKFQNIVKAQVHCVGTAAMKKSGQSVLENVKGYDASHLDENLHQDVQLATLLDW